MTGRKNKTVVPFPAARRKRKRLGGVMADARAEALRQRFAKASNDAQTGSTMTPLKKLLKRF